MQFRYAATVAQSVGLGLGLGTRRWLVQVQDGPHGHCWGALQQGTEPLTAWSANHAAAPSQNAYFFCIYNAAFCFFISFCFPRVQHSFRPKFLATAHQLKEEGFKVSTESLYVSTLVNGASWFLCSTLITILTSAPSLLFITFCLCYMSPYFCPLALCYWSHLCLAVCQWRVCHSGCLAHWEGRRHQFAQY